MGLPGDTSLIDESFTIYAGSVGSRKNIVIGADILYKTGVDGTTVLGLIASDEVWVNPSSVGGDNELTFNAAILAQGGSFQVSRECGDSSGEHPAAVLGGCPDLDPQHQRVDGDSSTPATSPHTSGPATTGSTNGSRRLRPPLYPLLGDSWSYVEWREQPLPCWAIPGGCEESS